MGVFPFPMPFSGPPKFGTMFTPASLFAASEPGGWYDPSDLTTLYQDAAGTTPVTAVEQPVGLVLDKSRGLVLGSELVTNGTFDSGTTDWTKLAGTTNPLSWDSSGKRLIVTNDLAYFAGATQTLSGLTIGKSYLVAATISNNTVDARVQISGLAGASSAIFPPGGGNARFVFAATATSHVVVLQNNQNTLNGVSYWDNISVRELPGSHLSQSTAAARPVLSARVNLLTRTQGAFSNTSSWFTGSTAISDNIATAPDGTSTASSINFNSGFRQNNISVGSGTALRGSIYAKKGTLNWLYFALYDGVDKGAWFNLDTGEKGTEQSGATASIESAGSGWWKCTVAITSSAATVNFGNLGGVTANSVALSANAGTIYIWGADLRPANAGVGLPAYQRVGAATSGSSTAAGNADYDTTGFPLYLKFDGTDDSLSTGAIDFTSTDKMSVFAGVRKLSDGSTGVVYELSAAAGGNNGSFHLYNSGGSANYTISSQGTSTASTSYTNAAIAAPITNVATSVLGISTDQCVLRLNGSQVAQSTTDQGTGNFGNYPLYVGRRGGTSLPFNGQLYSLIVRGAATDAATITATETWVNGKTKAY